MYFWFDRNMSNNTQWVMLLGINDKIINNNIYPFIVFWKSNKCEIALPQQQEHAFTNLEPLNKHDKLIQNRYKIDAR